ncbi:MAG: F0F1 ATP synthase subunit delta [Gammaproteobacteria bacterium]|jgi:F-type H+-transporting ATPase subunit b
MDLNWTTIVLEIVNFLVLVWILKRFLYQPVLRVIEERRRRVEASLAEARQREQQAEQLRSQYENRVAEWQQERQAAREALQQELQQQRAQALEALETSLEDARQKAQVREHRRWQELTDSAERNGLEQGARFASRLLEQLAGPELEARIVALTSKDLAGLPEEQRAALRRAAQAAGNQVQVETAHPLNPRQRDSVEHAVRSVLGEDLSCRYRETPALIAGLRLSVGDWWVGLDLRDELKGFVDTARAID